jgi:hypothetical protein
LKSRSFAIFGFIFKSASGENIASLTPQRSVISVKNDKGELIASSQALAYIKQPEKIK